MAEKNYLKISPNNERIGFGIYCSKCKGSPMNGICASTDKSDMKGKICSFPEKHKYKLEFHTKKGKRTRILEERDEKLAAAIAEEEYNYFRTHLHFSDEGKEEKVYETKPVSLLDWIQAFIAFKVKPTRNRKPVEKETLTDYILHLDILVSALFENKINAKLVDVKALNKVNVQLIFDFIKQKFTDGSTQEKYFRTYKMFWNYLKNEEDLSLPANPFNKWSFKKAQLKNEIIYEDEFHALIAIIDSLPNFERLKGKVRRRNFEWLKNAFKMGLTMGIRRQEVPSVKWNGITLCRTTNELYGGIMEVKDIKLSKLYDTDIYKYVSINLDLAELLVEMGYDNFKCQDKYLIDPEEKFSRDHIKNCLSNSFAYYIKPLSIKRDLSFECLRKTYATFSKKAGGEDFSLNATVHTNKEVMKAHYWNKFEAARTHEVFPRIFPKK